jgi:hypothetical protein
MDADAVAERVYSGEAVDTGALDADSEPEVDAEAVAEVMAKHGVGHYVAVLVVQVQNDPLIDLDGEDPEIAVDVRFLALTPETQADELNRCSDWMGVISYCKVGAGDVIRDREAEEQERKFTVCAGLKSGRRGGQGSRREADWPGSSAR